MNAWRTPGEVTPLRLGLALGGGVARGIAHLGVLEVLVEAGYRFDCVTGASAGSIIAAAYAAGLPLERLKAFAWELSWWKVARPVWPSKGFLSFDRLEAWFCREIGDLDFAELAIPFTAAATDLNTGRPVYLCSGRVARAVRASCSVPGVVTPVEMGGLTLVDGNFSDSVPVEAARRLGANFVIGVDIFVPKVRTWLGALGYGLAGIEMVIERAGGGVDAADFLITPALAGATYVNFRKKQALYEAGREAARQALPALAARLEQVRQLA